MGNPGSSPRRLAVKRIALVSLIVLLVAVACRDERPMPITAPNMAPAANPAVNLDQCANGPLATPAFCDLSGDWVNGNLGMSKAHYVEGSSVPYRILFSGLTTGSGSHTITIEWDVTKSGKHATDYLTSFDRTETNANPCAGVAGCIFAGPKSTFPIPIDPNVTNGFNGIDDPPGGPTGGDDITQVPGFFTLFNGTITGVTGYTTTGLLTGDASTRITITFTTTVADPVLAWGGHIATRANWGLSNSAISISGSPYHMRLFAFSDGNVGQQDRSLSAEAVIFPGSITIIKDAVPNDPQDFAFTTTGGTLTPTAFNLDDDADGTLPSTQAYTNITTFTTYTFTETPVTGWTLSFNTPVCTVTGANGGSQTTPSSVLTIDLKEGENVTCTFINTRQPAHLIVKKHVINDNGGGKNAPDFTLHVKSGTTDVTGSPAAGSEAGTNYTIDPGTYVVSEDGPPAGYANVTDNTNNLDCDASNSITLGPGETKTCVITNDDQAGSLTLVKHIVNDNGGTAGVGAFNIVTSAGSPSWTESPAGTFTSQTFSVNTGSSTFSEQDVTGYSEGTWSCTPVAATGTAFSGGSVTLANGQTTTCTITNNDDAGSLTLVKRIVNDNGGTATVGAFGITTNAGSLTFGPGTPDGANTLKYTSNTLTVNAGTYSLSENDLAGYTEGSWSCSAVSPTVAPGVAPVLVGPITGSVDVANGETKVCTITNDDQPGTIVIQKIIKPVGASTSFAFNTTGTGYTGFSLAGGAQNSQALNAGSYTAKELVPLGWVLTGIGGSTDPNTPFNCTITGSGGSTGVGDLNTQTVTISLKNGDVVTCVFENTGQGVTRTQGFWATHSQLANIAWFGGTGFGHTFPGVAGTGGIGDALICGRPIDDLGKVMGAFWSSIPKKSTGAQRGWLDQPRMQLLQQLIAAELNASAFGSAPSSGSIAAWETALCGTDLNAIKLAQQQAASFNSAGDNGTFTPGTSADSKAARLIANIPFWDIIKP